MGKGPMQPTLIVAAFSFCGDSSTMSNLSGSTGEGGGGALTLPLAQTLPQSLQPVQKGTRTGLKRAVPAPLQADEPPIASPTQVSGGGLREPARFAP